MRTTAYRAGASFMLMIVAAISANGADGTWTGATSAWQLDSNWSGASYPGTSVSDVATFSTAGSTTSTLASGTTTIRGMVFNGSTNYTVSGSGISNTMLKIDPNTASGANYITWSAGSATTQTFSDLVISLSDTLTGGQSKLLFAGGKTMVIDSTAGLELGPGSLYVEKTGFAVGSATLTVNGALTSTGAAVLRADAGSVVNLNLAGGSDLTNITLHAGNGGSGTINLLSNGSYGPNAILFNGDGAVVNVAASGISVTSAISFGLTSSSTTTLGATYTGTSTYAGSISLAAGTGSARTNAIDVGTGARLITSGTISGGNATNTTVLKTGAGVWEINRAVGNSFSANNVTVSAGTLLINNASNSAIGNAALNISSGAVLSGTGRVTGATAISGILAPGNSIGTLTIANDVTWNGGASATAATDWQFELGAGNTADLLNITGGTSDFLKGTGSVFRFDFLGSSDTGTFVLIDWEGTTNFNIGDFSYTNLGGPNMGTFQFNGSQLEFVAVVPEPHTWGLLTAGAIVTLLLRRRK